MTTDYMHVILSLFLVVICILVLMYFLKKLHASAYQKNQHIKIINSLPVGPKEKLLLIEVNNTYLLLGATATQIETLYAFNELSNTKSIMDNNVIDKNNFLDKMNFIRDRKKISS